VRGLGPLASSVRVIRGPPPCQPAFPLVDRDRQRRSHVARRKAPETDEWASLPLDGVTSLAQPCPGSEPTPLFGVASGVPRQEPLAADPHGGFSAVVRPTDEPVGRDREPGADFPHVRSPLPLPAPSQRTPNSGVVMRRVGVDDEEREFGGNVGNSIGVGPRASRQCSGYATCHLGQASEQLWAASGPVRPSSRIASEVVARISGSPPCRPAFPQVDCDRRGEVKWCEEGR